MKMHDGNRPLAAPAENTNPAVGQMPLDRPEREAGVDSVEHAVDDPRGRARQQPRQSAARPIRPVRAQSFAAAPGSAMRVDSLLLPPTTRPVHNLSNGGVASTIIRRRAGERRPPP